MERRSTLSNEVFLQSPMRRCHSSNNITHEQTPTEFEYMQAIRQSVIAEMYMLLPSAITNALNAQLPTALKKVIMEDSTIQSSLDTSSKIEETNKNNYKRDMEDIKKTQKELTKKIDGYKTQATKWINITSAWEEDVLPDFKSRIELLEKSWSSKEKSITNKTKDCLFTHRKTHEELEEITKIKKKLEKQLNDAQTEVKKVNEIDQSQKFVSAEYDEIKNKQTQHETEMQEIKRKLQRQEQKTERTANYTRLECLELGGVPTVLDCEGRENCKWQVMEICKELNYWLPEHTISTAHRKKQHYSKTGPAPIIVKFNCKDVRNDVYNLRHQIKDKFTWYCFNIKKLYINESLTPDTSKLFYSTRVFTKEMDRIHGKIFSWTFKGEVYIRKNVVGAPKRKITSLEDLNKIKKGILSIDPPSRIIIDSPTCITDNVNVAIPPRTDEERTAEVIKAMSQLNI